MLGQVWARASPWRADRNAGATRPAEARGSVSCSGLASACRRTHTLLSPKRARARRWRGRLCVVPSERLAVRGADARSWRTARARSESARVRRRGVDREQALGERSLPRKPGTSLPQRVFHAGDRRDRYTCCAVAPSLLSSRRAAPDGALCAQARSTERCTFPKALFGSSSTKKTSRGCLYSASAP